MELFATPCFFLEIFPHCIYPRAQEFQNWRGKRYRQRSHVSCPWESVCLLRLISGVRKVSETITEWFYHGSHILHEGRSWSWCHIILARVQFEYHCVWSSCTLGRGDKYQQDVALLLRSIIAGLQRIRELQTGCQQLTTCSWVLKSSFRNSSSGSPI